MIHVPLARYEIAKASDVGKRRWMSSLGCPLRNDMDYKDGWGHNIEGAAGELAAAKCFNIYWPGSVDTFQTQPDLSIGEVKTRSEHWHDLIIRKADVEDNNPDKRFIFVTGHSFRNDFHVRGWITADEAQNQDWWKAVGGRPAAWFVPSTALHTNWALLLDSLRPAFLAQPTAAQAP
jgi:hypothetical protein